MSKYIKYINAMRSLNIQSIGKAGQGHTGMAISACPITYTILTKFLNISKKNQKWINRDRIVLSAGHGSTSLYSPMHFAGFLSIDDMKNHKKKGCKTPGHPEYEENNFIDASTGPLGQGVAMSVGMAIAEKYLNGKFKQLINHYTYCIVGDGCLQEGISYEAMSLAGKLCLNKLIVVHDSNDCQLDAKVNECFEENLKLRMESINWEYIRCSNDVEEIEKSIRKAQKNKKPTFIEVKTIIGEGTSCAGSHLAHGLKVEEKEILNFEEYFKTKARNFKFDKEIYNHFNKTITQRGERKYSSWKQKLEKISKENPKLYNEFKKILSGKFIDISKIISSNDVKDYLATRDYVGIYMNQIYKNNVTDTIIGSADLASTTKLTFDVKKNFSVNRKYPEILYGIREFAMSGIQNGILLHGGLRSISSTFLSFSDYMKSSIRLGALMKLSSSYVFTHDSYQVGGDGPTHQPYDQIPMLRSIDGVYLYRPCDKIESLYTITKLFSTNKETSIGIFSRQPILSVKGTSLSGCEKGGYIVKNSTNNDLTIAASGSEVGLAFEIANSLEQENIKVKIVSVPSLKKFLNNDEKYIKNTLSSKFGLLAIEASSDNTWYKLQKFVNNFYFQGAFTFGESMDGEELYREKGFCKEFLIPIIKKQILK